MPPLRAAVRPLGRAAARRGNRSVPLPSLRREVARRRRLRSHPGGVTRGPIFQGALGRYRLRDDAPVPINCRWLRPGSVYAGRLMVGDAGGRFAEPLVRLFPSASDSGESFDIELAFVHRLTDGRG